MSVAAVLGLQAGRLVSAVLQPLTSDTCGHMIMKLPRPCRYNHKIIVVLIITMIVDELSQEGSTH